MRRQYHFRTTQQGLLIWDVKRLVALSRGLPVVKVPLSAIHELDEDYWFEHGQAATCRNVAKHARLMLEADLDFPIILSPDGRVMDGMHRVAKAHLEGHTEIDAVRLEETPDPDYINMSPKDLPY